MRKFDDADYISKLSRSFWEYFTLFLLFIPIIISLSIAFGNPIENIRNITLEDLWSNYNLKIAFRLLATIVFCVYIIYSFVLGNRYNLSYWTHFIIGVSFPLLIMIYADRFLEINNQAWIPGFFILPTGWLFCKWFYETIPDE